MPDTNPPHVFSDCCLEVCIPPDAVPALTLNEDDVDPFTGETIMWPSPRVYWSNGTITDGAAQ